MFNLADNENAFFETWYEEFGQYLEQDKNAMKVAYLAESAHHTAEIEKRDRAIEVLMRIENKVHNSSYLIATYTGEEILKTIKEAQAILGDKE